ncbi:MAG: hypothetical protein AAGB22_04200 [Bacteroidota bacterium]
MSDRQEQAVVRAAGKAPGKRSSGSKRYQRQFRKDRDWHWAYTLMLAGLFVGLFSLVFVGGRTLISPIFLSRVVAFSCVVGLLVPLRWYARWFDLGKLEAFLLNVLGFGPLLCSLLLWTNFGIRLEYRDAEHAVLAYEYRAGGFPSEPEIIFTLKDSAYHAYEEFRRFSLLEASPGIARTRFLRYRTARGLWGYWVVTDVNTANEPMIPRS